MVSAMRTIRQGGREEAETPDLTQITHDRDVTVPALARSPLMIAGAQDQGQALGGARSCFGAGLK